MFRRTNTHPIILFIIGLACFGLLYQLVFNPIGLIKNLIMAVVVLGILIFIYKLVMQKRFGGHMTQDHTKYKKAVQQTKKRLSNETASQTTTKVRGFSQKRPNSKKTFRSSPLNRRREHNFTVIEGKKGKKKNRAHF